MITKTLSGLVFQRDYDYHGDVIALKTSTKTTLEKLQDALLELLVLYPFGPQVWILSAYDEEDNKISVEFNDIDGYFTEYLLIKCDLQVTRIDDVSRYNEVRKKKLYV